MRYTKEKLEQIVLVQFDNLNAMDELISLMRTQNDLLHKANEKLKREIQGAKVRRYDYQRVRKGPKSKTQAA